MPEVYRSFIYHCLKLCLSSFFIFSSMFVQAEVSFDNFRVSTDVSTIIADDISGSEGSSQALFYGIDLINVINNDKGNLGTLLVQVYQHKYFKGGSVYNTKNVFRNVNFNYTQLYQGKLNFRVGHFEVPFGLEQVIATNGTLLDYYNGEKLGLKADWGVSVNGDLTDFEYEVAAMQGSGNDFDSNQHTYVYSGRIGSNRNQDIFFGVSAFNAKLLNKNAFDQPFKKSSRYAFDISWKYGPFITMAEIVRGNDDGVKLKSNLLEVDWLSRYENIKLYLQLSKFSASNITFQQKSHQKVALGFRYEKGFEWQLDLQWVEKNFNEDDVATSKQIRALARYRFDLF